MLRTKYFCIHETPIILILAADLLFHVSPAGRTTLPAFCSAWRVSATLFLRRACFCFVGDSLRKRFHCTRTAHLRFLSRPFPLQIPFFFLRLHSVRNCPRIQYQQQAGSHMAGWPVGGGRPMADCLRHGMGLAKPQVLAAPPQLCIFYGCHRRCCRAENPCHQSVGFPAPPKAIPEKIGENECFAHSDNPARTLRRRATCQRSNHSMDIPCPVKQPLFPVFIITAALHAAFPRP